MMTPREPVVVEEADTSSFRFLTPKTTPFRVKSLPDVDFNLGEMYSGNIAINKSDPSRTLFFVFQPTIGEPVDEVTIWLNGGPGCSSLEGFFQENGRFLWQVGIGKPVENPYTWVNLTNMLWVEQPVTTGFATGNATATSEEEIAQDFIHFFKNFETLFGIKKFKIYVTGESYAGRYVPYISAAMLDEKDKEFFDLSGALMYDPCIGQFAYVAEQVPVVPFVKKNANLFNFNETFMQDLESMHKECGYADFIDKFMVFPATKHQPPVPGTQPANGGKCDIFDNVLFEALGPNPCFNPYEISNMCPIGLDVLGFPTILEEIPTGFELYFNRADVKAAMHAPANVQWGECSGNPFVGHGGPELEGDLSADPIQKVLPQVIEATNRVLVANGDFDMIILTDGTLLSIQNMTWNGKLGFQKKPSTPINIRIPDLQYRAAFRENGLAGADGPQGIMGIQHFERGLMWAETFQSGHMGPQFQPRVAYRHLQWVLGRTNML